MFQSLQKKAIPAVLLLLLITLSGFLFVRQTALMQTRLITTSIEQEKDTFFNKLLPLKSLPLETFVNDYSYWDDMLYFLKTNNRRWALANIDPCIEKYELSAVWIYTIDSLLAYSVTNNDIEGTFTPLPRYACGEIFAEKRFCHFFITTSSGVMEVRGATIHPSSDEKRTTTPQGYLLAGRLWNKQYFEGFTRMVGGSIAVQPPHTTGPVPDIFDRKAGTISFSRILTDWNGKPVTQVEVIADSPIVKELARLAHYQVALAVLFIVCLIILFLLFLTDFTHTTPTAAVAGQPIGQETKALQPAQPAALQGSLNRDEVLLLEFLTQRTKIIKPSHLNLVPDTQEKRSTLENSFLKGNLSGKPADSYPVVSAIGNIEPIVIHEKSDKITEDRVPCQTSAPETIDQLDDVSFMTLDIEPDDTIEDNRRIS
jgi:hypothetical protein